VAVAGGLAGFGIGHATAGEDDGGSGVSERGFEDREGPGHHGEDGERPPGPGPQFQEPDGEDGEETTLDGSTPDESTSRT
jgi:hypothetical protein